MPRIITNEVLEGYLNCALKGYLKLVGETGSISNYESMMARARATIRSRVLNQHDDRCSHGTIQRDVDVTRESLKQGVELILDGKIEMSRYLLQLDGLTRVAGASDPGGRHYIPMLINEGNTTRKPQKLLLAAYGIILGRIQDRRPETGILIHGKEYRFRKVQLGRLYAEAEEVIQAIERMAETPARPRLVLNDHCQICEYRQRCRNQALEEGNLSLIRGITSKEIARYARKGIFSTTQLAHTFRPRRKGKRTEPKNPKRQFALQAMAVRDKTVYVLGTPTLPSSHTDVFLDVESDPEENYVYLIGMIVRNGDCEKTYSFWADDAGGERDIVKQLLITLSRLKDFSLYSYGHYEKAFLNRVRKSAEDTTQIDRNLSSLTNVLSVIYDHIYFPTWSNGLKDIAGCLGYKWRSPEASGVESIVWRSRWDTTHDHHWKRTLIEYNLDDCRGLQIVTDFVKAIAGGAQRDEIESRRRLGNLPVSEVQELDRLASRRKWGTVNFVYDDYAYINGCAYFNYQRQRVYARSIKSLKATTTSIREQNKRLRTTRRVVVIDETCEKCNSTAVETLDQHPVTHRGPRTKRAFDLVATKHGVKLDVIDSQSKVHQCQECGHLFVPRGHSRLAKYFHGLQSYAMYLHVGHGLSFGTARELTEVFFDLSIQKSYMHRFKMLMARYYEPTYQQLLAKMLSGNLLHVDETQVRLKGGKGYVWAFTNLEEVVYMFRPNREGEFLHDLLRSFKGVLVTDFYAAYDSIDCPQQKCLIHLIRDMNDDLHSNPFDSELQAITEPFGTLLRPIVEAISQHGMKRSRLKRFKRSIAKYFERIEAMSPQSDAARALRTRLLKYHDKLFTFVDYDNVPWNNNNAENAIKRFALYRARVPGMLKASGLSDYLTLLSICHTCRFKRINFWKFLLSREQDIDTFGSRMSARRRKNSVETYPEGYMTPFDVLRKGET